MFVSNEVNMRSLTTVDADFFMKGLKQTPRAANDSIRSLENLAHSLDVNVGEAFKEFISRK